MWDEDYHLCSGRGNIFIQFSYRRCLVLMQGTDEFLTTEEALLIEVAQSVVKSGALLGSDTSPCSLSGGCSGS